MCTRSEYHGTVGTIFYRGTIFNLPKAGVDLADFRVCVIIVVLTDGSYIKGNTRYDNR